jgi:peptidoglycan/LPS O-acetylase OafA/YrhL
MWNKLFSFTGISSSKTINPLFLGNLTNGRENNLDALRLIGAFLVLYSHSFILAGYKQPGPPFYQSTYGGLGVQIFFVISGFLITQSYLRSNDPIRFLEGRFLRIFPALICVIVISTFLLGPLMTTLPLKEYFSSSQTYSYLRMISLYDVRYNLPGVFITNSYPYAVNGSIWTLEYEFSLYLLVLFLGMVGFLRNKLFVLSLFLIALVLNYLGIGKTTSIFTLNVYYAIQFTVYFGFGMVTYLYRDSIPLKWGVSLLAISMLILSSFKQGFTDTLFVIILGYLVLFIGYSRKIRLTWLTRFGDFSYGIYIWAFPIQQTVVSLYGGKMNPWFLILLSTSITIILGALSWHLVEKRMLKLKNTKFTFSVKTKPSDST